MNFMGQNSFWANKYICMGKKCLRAFNYVNMALIITLLTAKINKLVAMINKENTVAVSRQTHVRISFRQPNILCIS